MKPILITIDGPAGAGKTTVSRSLAKRLGYRYIDTGALYRGVAFEAKSKGLSHDDDVGLENLCVSLDLKFVFAEDLLRQCASTARELHLFSNNKDITDQIRNPEISMFASAVSARPVVRRYLLDLQRDMASGKGVVFEGRDMGTVVFPGADIKFFLDASRKTRALRRYKELSSKTSLTIEEIEQDINCRDENDRTRSLAPLKPADDAIIIDSTDLSADEVVELMLSHIAEKTG
jgi:cytidylate kinase